METREVARLAALAAEEKKGRDVVILDISGISLIADYFVITSVANRMQLAAIADRVEEVLAEHGVPLLHREGHGNATWILLDYGGVVVHVMLDEARDFYGLERLWGDAPVLRPEALTTGAHSSIISGVTSENARNEEE